MSQINISQYEEYHYTGLEIAVIGIACRFPGARNSAEFWENLKNGTESISFFTDEELKESGIEAEELQNPNYIRARGVLKDIEYFDALFFGFTPPEAEVMDPQMRICHECTWHALEDAGYNPEIYGGRIGFYAGASPNFSWEAQAIISGQLAGANTFISEQLYNSHYLVLRICYNLKLTGPGVGISSTCSTSLVAIDMACKGIITGQCDIAVAGGVSIRLPQNRGYLYQDGMVNSPDGHVRTFDALAKGVNGGDGIGLVVLKQLEEAVADGDHIYAVIKGSAINNDGRRKVGFTAPSVEGQAEVIRAALRMAEVEAESIGYIEAHGTATPLGDVIEIEALKRAFNTDKRNFCGIGSVKSNIGHLDRAAGVAGFIKAVLAIKHKQIPQSLNFKNPNPKIDFENSPFYVVSKLTAWQKNKYPLRAGISAFGIGGTNAHVILEEAPPMKLQENSGPAQDFQLLLLSAKTQPALDRVTENFIRHLKDHPGLNLADAAYTMMVGRGAFKHRKMAIASGIPEAIDILSDPNSWKVHESKAAEGDRPVIFMFSGQGQQYVNMGLDLYRKEAVYRTEMDRCFEILKPLLGYDIKEILYPGEYASDGGSDGGNSFHFGNDKIADLIFRQDTTQSVMFVCEYAMARLLMAWGIQPYAMIGYSIGEYVAAALAGVFSLEDALQIVALRGTLMQEIPGGLMVSVPLTEKELIPLVNGYDSIGIAVVNGPSCIVSGKDEDIRAFEHYLKNEKHLMCMPLNISHAGHSKMMDPMMEKFHEGLKRIAFKKPEIPYISTLTGRWITVEEASDPLYWTRHLRETVRFAQGMTELLKVENAIFVESGPGRSLSTSVMQHPNRREEHVVLDLLRYPNQNTTDDYYLMNKIGRLWLCGKHIAGEKFYQGESRQRVSLPVYPFDKYTYPVEISALAKFIKGDMKGDIKGVSQFAPQKPKGKQADIADWFYLPAWKPSMLPISLDRNAETAEASCWLVFMNHCRLGHLLVEKLREELPHLKLALVEPGVQFSAFSTGNNGKYTIIPGESTHYQRLLDSLAEGGNKVSAVLHLWNLTGGEAHDPGIERFDACQEEGYYSLIYLAQALGNQGLKYHVTITVLSDSMQAVSGSTLLYPERATLLGPVQIIPREYANISCRSVDIVLPKPGTGEEKKLLTRLSEECTAESGAKIVAYRGNQRFIQTFESFRLDNTGSIPRRLKEKGVYLISGGMGGIGLELAQYLAETVKARLILVGRSSFPAQEEWQQCLTKNGAADTVSLKIRKLQAMEAHGAEVMVAGADVSDYQQMAAVFKRVKERFGAVDGIIHCALNLDGSFIHRVTREITNRVFASKIKGALVLKQFVEEFQPDFFILCSSLSSVLGNPGEVIYCAANTFLDALANHMYTCEESDPAAQTYTTAVNWDAWQEVGGSVETVKRMIHSQLNINLTTENLTVQNIGHPLLQSRTQPKAGQVVYISRLTPAKHWPLDEHRVMGTATLPGTAYLEMARAAFEDHQGNSHMEIRDLYLIAPLSIRDNEEKEVHTILENQGAEFEFRIMSRGGSGENQWQEHARGKISGTGIPAPLQHGVEELAAMCPIKQEMSETPVTPVINDDLHHAQNPTRFGPRWTRITRKEQYGEKHQLTEVELSEAFLADRESYKVHPSLLDCALAVRQGDGFHIPFFYKKIKMYGSLPAKVFSYITPLAQHDTGAASAASKTHRFNVTIMDEQGMELLTIEEYTLVQVVEKTDISALSALSEPGNAKTPGHDSLASTLLKKQLQDGLLSTEGVDVFTRILAGTLPRFIVSTQELQSRLQGDMNFNSPRVSEILAENQAPGPIHARPELSTKYVAPSSETEKNLAEVWSKFLGIDCVGINDNFFDLGATSLTIMQISTLLKNKLGKDVSIINMYTYPTINELAQFLDQGKSPEVPRTEKSSLAESRGNALSRRKANIKGEPNA